MVKDLCWFTVLSYIAVTCCLAGKQRYDGTSVVRLWVNNGLMRAVDDLIRKHPQLDEWSRQVPPGSHRSGLGPHQNLTIDIMVQLPARDEFWNLVRHNFIKYDVIIPDVQRLVDSQRSERTRTRNKRSNRRRDRDLYSIVGTYPRYQQIIDWLYRLSRARPKLVSIIDIGASSERRQIRLVKISSAPAGVQRKSVWLDAAIHAREWIGPATAIYIIQQLVENYGKDDNITRLVDTYDWYFLPLANPDGYEYSHTHNRLWRKTRSRHGESVGVDLNRNFNFHWENCTHFVDGGTNAELTDEMFMACFDNHPAYDVYAGPEPLSEPEAAAIARYLLDNGSKFHFYFSLHAYAQLWLVPWAYSHELAEDFVELMLLSEIGTTALGQQYGTGYVRGPPAVILYQAGGTTMDWAKGVAGIKYSFIIELRDTGTFGFLLPESEIVPTASETLDGISAVVNALNDPRKKEAIRQHGTGKRGKLTMRRYKRYLEQHISHWGGMNRTHTLSPMNIQDVEDESWSRFLSSP